MFNRNPKENGANFRPAGYSDSDDDSDFCFQEPIHPSNNHYRDQDLNNRVQERFQSIVIQGKFLEFEKMFREELNSTADYRFENGWTPLMYACFHGQPPMADFLLERDADPNAHADSVTPLMLLCTNAFGTDEQLRGMALKLLDKGAIVNLGDKQGVTPLMRAIQCGRKDLLELFVENNANIEMRDRQGWTAIFWAVHCNQTDMMGRLITLGARIIEVDRANRTILDIAESHENSINVKILEPYFNVHNAEEPKFVYQEPDYWLEYYPGLRKNHKQLYKEEIVNLLYGMNCDNLRPLILNSGIDLSTFLLLEEKDMIKLGIEMQFERHRLKQGLRAFHLRNWKLKSVSGLYARQTEHYNLCECLETAATNLMQFYILEASLQYTIREFNRIPGQIKKEALGTHIISQINDSINKLCINIKNIKKEIDQMQQSLIFVSNPVSAYVCCLLFVVRALRQCTRRPSAFVRMGVRLARDVTLDPRPEYARAILRFGTSGDIPTAILLGNQCSSRLLSACGASVLLELPGASPAQSRIAAGTSLFALITGRIDYLRHNDVVTLPTH